MTKDDILNSIQLKKRFCKDCNLPISIFDSPYFYERLCILDCLYDCVAKFDLFCTELLSFENEQSYFEYYNSVKDKMITSIKVNAAYQQFNTMTIGKSPVRIGKKSLYIEENNGKTFISVDMKKANFSAMNFYSKDIFDCQKWESFVARYTNSQHIQKSKYIRQVVLGACNPKKQIQYEHYLMTLLYLHIKNTLDDYSFEVYSVGEDEILILVDDLLCSINKIKNAISSCPNGIGSLVRVEMFDLQKLGDYGWLKTIRGDNQTIQFKCVSAEIFHQAVKCYYNIPITENDLVFRHNGKLAKFLDPISIY